MIFETGEPIFIGHAIVDQHGRYADANGLMPDALRFEDDFARLQRQLDLSSICVMGRLTHYAAPNPHGRNRWVITTQNLPPEPHASFIHPDNLASYMTCHAHPHDRVAVLGGARVYELFRQLGYSEFHLTVVEDVDLSGGMRLLLDCESLDAVIAKLEESSRIVRMRRIAATAGA